MENFDPQTKDDILNRRQIQLQDGRYMIFYSFDSEESEDSAGVSESKSNKHSSGEKDSV
jgi:hypothetical protein